MGTLYVITHRARPHLSLFQGTLEQVAQAIAAQPDSEDLIVYANTGSFNRDLTPDERRELAQECAGA